MLHNAGNQHILAIGNNVDFQFRPHHIFIDKHRIFNTALQNPVHIFFHVIVAEVASKVMIGKPLATLGYGTGLYKTPPYYAAKVPVFSFEKLSDAIITLEATSTIGTPVTLLI